MMGLISLLTDGLILEFIVIAVAIIFALSIHEFAHAWVAFRHGDTTAQLNGRLTINPIKHLDLIGSLALLFIGFGWAKPVPVDPQNLENPRRAMVRISFAGPLSNLLLALISGIILRVIIETTFTQGNVISEIEQTIFLIFYYFMVINCLLFFFNLLPVHPLDGSKILYGLLPERYLQHIGKIMIYTQYALLGIIVISIIMEITGNRGLLSYIFGPLIDFSSQLMTFHFIFPSEESQRFFMALKFGSG
jgi:Zn-dependent protease